MRRSFGARSRWFSLCFLLILALCFLPPANLDASFDLKQNTIPLRTKTIFDKDNRGVGQQYALISQPQWEKDGVSGWILYLKPHHRAYTQTIPFHPVLSLTWLRPLVSIMQDVGQGEMATRMGGHAPPPMAQIKKAKKSA